ncbi:hypothetical protein [Desmospora activa]|nr:hypothetical protein [Desmospora activa]
MEKWLNSFAHLSHATQDRKALNDLIAALSQKKNNSSSRSTGGSSGKSISDSPGSTVFVNNDNNDDKGSSAFPKPHSNDGDSLYDLINAPGMNKIVDHVMKNRQSRRGKKK